MTLAPEHPLTLELSRGTPQEREVQEFVERVRKQDKIKRTADDYEKEGLFIGAYCRNPLTGGKMPIFAGNFVLMEYGTGAVMAVPDPRSEGLLFCQEIQPSSRRRHSARRETSDLSAETMEEAFCDDGVLVNSGPFSGMTSAQAREAIGRHLEEKGLGKKTIHYRLRDWGISRQRYWGAPIPIIFCPDCGTVPVRGKGSSGGSPPGYKADRQRSFAPGFGSGVREYDLPALRKAGEAGNRYHGHLCGVFLVF